MLRTLLIISGLLIISCNLQAQTKIDTSKFLPGVESIKQDFKNHCEKKKEAELLEYNFSVKNKWLRFLPTIGFNLIPLSPIIALNSSNMISYAEHNAQRKAKIMTIIRTNDLQFEEGCINLNYQYLDLQKQIAFYNEQLELFKLHKSRFEIVSKSYVNQEIVPSVFLDKQIEFNSLILALKQSELSIQQNKYKILASFYYSGITKSNQ